MLRMNFARLSPFCEVKQKWRLGKRDVEEYQESFTLIQEEAERLSRIVEDLFILARQPIETPARMIKESVSLSEVVKDCARAAQVLAVRKGVRLNLENDSTSIAFKGDEELIKRMILNFLDNAVKYTPEGGEISLALARQMETTKSWCATPGSEFPRLISTTFLIVSIAWIRPAHVHWEEPVSDYRSCAVLSRLMEDKSGSKARLVTAALHRLIASQNWYQLAIKSTKSTKRRSQESHPHWFTFFLCFLCLFVANWDS